MPTFVYRARTETADEARGTLDAGDLRQAVLRLRGQGLYPVEIAPRVEPAPPPAASKTPRKLSHAERAFFSRQLAQALAGGVPLVRILELLGQQRNPRLSGAATALREQVLQGVALADAMRQLPGAFPEATVALVRAGEAGGALEEGLRRAAELAERDAELIGRLRTAMAYPAFVLGLGLVTLVVLLVVAVPRLAQVFHELGAPLPWITRLVIGTSRLLATAGGVVILLAGAVGWMGWRRGWLTTMRARLGQMVARIPMIRQVLNDADLARWTQTTGLLVGQGLTLTEALGFSQDVVSFQRCRQALGRVRHDVVEGIPLSEALAAAGVGDSLLHTLVAVGEAQGDLSRNLLQAARGYAESVDRVVKVVSTLIEPLMIVVVGLVVGGIVFSMLLPVFQVSTAIR